MDTELLVASKIEDGKRLVNQLVEDGFVVTVAFWVKTAEEGLWHLYIASPFVEAERPGKAYPTLYASLSKIPDLWVQLSDIMLVNEANPIALDVVAMRDRFPARMPTRVRRKRIGNVSIAEAYIYPPPPKPGSELQAPKHGARVYLLKGGVALVKQTVKKGIGPRERYVVDGGRERHIDPGDDAALGAAVRAALGGRL